MFTRKDFFFAVKIFALCSLLTSCKGKEFTALFLTPDGPIEVSLEMARTPEERQRGLMFRDRIGDRHGMLFCFETDERHVFWMRNTYLSLDILFVTVDGVVVDVLEKLPPCPLDPCPTYRAEAKARYALELNAGFSERYRIRKGDRVQLKIDG
jgi:uncharacterized membrane protein (UPF0127 family)